MNYKPKQEYKVSKFAMELYPFISPPENCFTKEASIQYGADFKLSFHREGTQKNNIGLIQLIFPQTKIFGHTLPSQWNVDKREPGNSEIKMGKCLYGEAGRKIGEQSQYYKDQLQQYLSPNDCSLIDTPRELNNKFDERGNFIGNTNTKFANYVVQLNGKNGNVFNEGLVWGYSIIQDKDNFNVKVITPKICLFKENNEHMDAIARFLKIDMVTVKSFAL